MFYVYILARPNRQPFYVGKGKDSRVFQHEDEARRGCPCPKCEVIRGVWKRGGEVQRYIVYTTLDSTDALRYEAELIAAIGRNRLTNQVDGGGGTRNKSPQLLARIAAGHAQRRVEQAARIAQERERMEAVHAERVSRWHAAQEAERVKREQRRTMIENSVLRWVVRPTIERINATRTKDGLPELTTETIAKEASISEQYLVSLMDESATHLRPQECGNLCRYLKITVDDVLAYVPRNTVGSVGA